MKSLRGSRELLLRRMPIPLVMLLLTGNNSPYTTDPVSDRVVEMAEHYTEFPFNDAEGWFGEMAMYVRKD